MAKEVIYVELHGNLGTDAVLAVVYLSCLVVHNAHFPILVAVQPVQVTEKPESANKAVVWLLKADNPEIYAKYKKETKVSESLTYKVL